MNADGLADDGLLLPTVGDWAEEKYRLVECYARIFATSMKDRWDERVYVDLFAASGRARVREQRRIIQTTALRVLQIPHPFDRYIFCDIHPRTLATLEQRVRALSPGLDVRFVPGDANEKVDTILSLIPHGTSAHRVLSFCFLDPFQLANLQFATVRRLAGRYMDFLVLIPTGMDPGRNRHTYTKPENRAIERFTGASDWRTRWKPEGGLPFGDFVVDEFGRSMAALGYRYDGLAVTHQMRNTKKRSPIYRLAVFSRHSLGSKFWEECRKYTSDQTSLF
jgi:three-Cys-motif partner protein